jgi:hypothetical protein
VTRFLNQAEGTKFQLKLQVPANIWSFIRTVKRQNGSAGEDEIDLRAFRAERRERNPG